MSFRNLGRVFVAVVGLCLVLSSARADDKQPAGAPTPEQIQQFMQAAAPGPEHQAFKELTGTWDAVVKYMPPGAPPEAAQVSNGVMKIDTILDGRFMTMNYEGTIDMGGGPMPFKGLGITGYDNMKKKYINMWIDSMGTSMMTSEGTRNGNVITNLGEMLDPMTGKMTKFKEVITNTDKDHMTYEMHVAGPDGSMMRMMEIKYTRKS